MNSNMMLLAAVLLIAVPVIILLFLNYQRLKGMGSAADKEILLNLINSLRQDIASSSSQNRQEIQARLDTIAGELGRNSAENLKTIQSQFRQSADIIKDVTERLTKIDGTNKQILDFSGKLQSLENILKNPKQRGILGEYFLETLLGNVLQPEQYRMQYKFSDGDMVDAAIFYRDKIIPVDAKFSLEKYNLIMETTDASRREVLEKEFRNDVKTRIDETAKYIKPRENTTEFAFMFVPAEGIYYNLLIYNVGSVQINMQNLIEYAFRKHVVIVSPTSFFAYLETVLQGMKAQKVEENIREIIKKVHELARHLGSYEESLVKLGKNLSTTITSYNSAYKEFKKVDKDIYKITEGEAGGKAEPILIDKPFDEH